jgi:hypothetical protein
MQIELGDKYLQIQGFVSLETLEVMAKSLPWESGAYWFFVEYAPATYPKGATFNFIIDNAGKKMEQGFYNMRLLNIIDQFGFSQDEISEGWKTICQFAIDPLPQIMKTLPVLDSWKYNPNGIKLLSFSDFTLQDENALTEKMYNLALDQILSWAINADPANRKVFAHSLWDIINANRDDIKKKASPDSVRKVEETLQAFEDAPSYRSDRY